MAYMRNSKTAITLFEAQVIPSLLFNSESWIRISDAHLNTLQAFQDGFISRLLHYIIRMDSGMLLMKWIIAAKNLQFTNKIRTKDDDSQAHNSEIK